ncbi:MAG TPA: hypothetical protein VIM58_02310, partial [Candidatus Methylacidiphilales bacterium]
MNPVNDPKPSFPALAGLLAIAEAEVGVQEMPPGSGRGPRVEAYQAVCSLASSEATGWPWCAAFVCWCLKNFVARHPGALARPIEDDLPREASVYGLEAWARRKGLPFSDDRDNPIAPLPGDLVFYRFSHVEIVRRVLPDRFEAVGGNTNDAGSRNGGHVAVRQRSYQVARAFARLVPRALPVAPSVPT